MISPYRVSPVRSVQHVRYKWVFREGFYAHKWAVGAFVLWVLAFLCDIPLIIWEPSVLRWVTFVSHVICVGCWGYIVYTGLERKAFRPGVDSDSHDNTV